MEFTREKEVYGELLTKSLVPTLLDPANPEVQLMHAHFDADPAPSFDAPLTNLVFVKSKAGTSRAELEPVIKQLVEKMNAFTRETTAQWATIEEEPESIIMLEGWLDKEVCFSLYLF
jgi:hypothetical protein